MAFAPGEAAKLTGLSPWRLKHWRDIVEPQWPSGAYTFRDLVALRTLTELQKQHEIPTRELRRAAKFIQQRADDALSGVKIGVGPNNKVAFFSKKDGVWEVADGSGQTIAEVVLDHVMAALKKDVKATRTRPKSQWGSIEKTPGVCGGKERFAGTRVAVGLVVDLVNAGASPQAIRDEFPTLQAPDVALARKLAARE